MGGKQNKLLDDFKHDRHPRDYSYHGHLFLLCHKYANSLILCADCPQKPLCGEESDHTKHPSCLLPDDDSQISHETLNDERDDERDGGESFAKMEDVSFSNKETSARNTEQ